MGDLVVPRTVLEPVGGRDFVPWIVEGAFGFEDFHCGGMEVVYVYLDLGDN